MSYIREYVAFFIFRRLLIMVYLLNYIYIYHIFKKIRCDFVNLQASDLPITDI